MDGSFQTPEKVTDLHNRVYYRKSSEKDHNTNFDAPSQPAGNLAVQRLLRSGVIRPKLAISQPGDMYEREADRIAEQVMRTPEPALQRACAGCESGATPFPACEEKTAIAQRKADHDSHAKSDSASASFVESLGSGRPLDPETRTFFEPRFGTDFGHVRVHTDARAAESAHALSAQAYTVGRDLVFRVGQYTPGSNEGRRLLAHELAHVVQQRQGASMKIRMSRLRDFEDEDEKHDPAKLTDAQIEATNEFKAYMDSKLIWQWQLKVTREEALLASRLILRKMRDGKPVTWESQARGFALTARKQLGTLKETEKLVGKLEWVPSQESEFKDPAAAESDFARFALAGGPEPTATSKMNCFEMILFGAFRGGMITKDRIQKIYAEAAKKFDMAVPAEVEKHLCQGSKGTFNPADPKSPEPLPGDIIIFDFIALHAAISLGTKDASGKHEVINLVGSNDPTLGTKVAKTTIEKLLPLAGLSTVKFCTSSW